MSDADQALVVDGFRQRGMDTTRIETFVDAAFAFALTMLVISFDAIPQSMDELFAALKNVPAFALSFAQIATFWYGHHLWSRRYGLDDLLTVTLSLFLVFVTLIYVYPLRIVFSGFMSWVSNNYFPYVFPSSTAAEIGMVFVIYGVGFVGMCVPLALLYWHAGRRAQQLALSAWERFVTRWEMWNWTFLGITGGASIAFALFAPASYRPFAGFAYATLGISMPLFAVYQGRRAKRLGIAPSA